MKIMQESFWKIYSANKIALLCYFVIATVAFSPMLMSDKNIGHAIDWDVPNDPSLIHRQSTVNNFIWWDNFMGSDRGFYIRSFFHNFTVLFPSGLLGISGSALSKSYILLTSVFGAYFFYRFANKLQARLFSSSNQVVSFLAGLFYSLSIFKLNFLISGEFYSFILGFTIIPLLFHALSNYFQSPSLRNIIIFSIFFVGLTISWQQFILLVFPIMITSLLLFARRSETMLHLKHTIFFFILTIILSAWFLLPTITFRSYEQQITEGIPSGYLREETTFRIQNSLTDAEWPWHFMLNQNPALYLYSIFFAIILLPLLFLRRGSRAVTITVSSLLAVGLFYLAMANGQEGPLGNAIPSLANNNLTSWYIQLLRSPVDFLIGYHIILSFLLIVGLHMLASLLKRYRVAKSPLVASLVLLVLFPYPIWQDFLNRDIDYDTAFPNLYNENPDIISFYHSIENEDDDYRILFVPAVRYLKYLPTDFQNQRGDSPDPLLLWSPKQVIDESNPNTRTEIVRFIREGLRDLNSGALLYYLELLDIKYIALREDVAAPQWAISNSVDLVALKEYLTKNDQLFENTFEGQTLSVFKYKLYDSSRLAYYNRENNDSTISFENMQSPTIDLVSLAKDLRIEPRICADAVKIVESTDRTNIHYSSCDGANWMHVVKPFLLNVNSLYRFEIIDFASNTPFHIKIYFQDVDVEDNNEALVKILPVNDKDAYYFYNTRERGLQGMLYGYFDTLSIMKAEQTDFVYAYVTLMVDSNDVRMREGDISFRQISVYEVDATNPTGSEHIEYAKINPTIWKANLNTTEPVILQFSESYSPNWQALVYRDGKLQETIDSFPIYSFLNGFTIDETGNLEVMILYQPQKWFETGLQISGTALVVSLAYILYDQLKVNRIQNNKYIQLFISLLPFGHKLTTKTRTRNH